MHLVYYYLALASAAVLPALATTYTLNGTYYVGGGPPSGGYCGYTAVATGNITSGKCMQDTTYSISITPSKTK